MDDQLDFRVKELIHMFEKGCRGKKTDSTDSGQVKPISDSPSKEASKPAEKTHLIVHLSSEDEEEEKKTPVSAQTPHSPPHGKEKNKSEVKPIKIETLVVEHTREVPRNTSSKEQRHKVEHLEEQLKITRIENERLRTQLSTSDKKLADAEAEMERLQKSGQSRDSLVQLNDITRQVEETSKLKKNYETVKEELEKLQRELQKEKRLRHDQEKSLTGANATISDLSKQLEAKDKILSHDKKQNNEVIAELANEKRLRMELTEQKNEATKTIVTLSKQLEGHEKTALEHKNSLQELKNELQLKKQQEKLLNETREKISHLSKQIEEKDKLVVHLQKENEKLQTAANKELKDDKDAQIRQEALQGDSRKEINTLTLKLEATEVELSRAKKELAKERALKKNQDTQFADTSKKISELSKMLNEKENEIELLKREKDQEKSKQIHLSTRIETQNSIDKDFVRMVSTNPFLSHSETAFPEVPTSSQPLTHTGVDRPKRKKNKFVRSASGSLAHDQALPNGDEDNDSSS